MHDGHERVSATVGFNACDLAAAVAHVLLQARRSGTPRQVLRAYWRKSTCDRIGEVNRDSGIADRPSALA